jgi:hypothetical protein
VVCDPQRLDARIAHLPEDLLNKAVLTACAVAALLWAPPAVSAQSRIEGPWTFTVISPEGTFDIPLTIAREADGLVARIPTGEVFLTGNETPDGVEFFWPLVYQGMDLPTTLTGSFGDGGWAGSADFGGLAEGTWAARPAGIARP